MNVDDIDSEVYALQHDRHGKHRNQFHHLEKILENNVDLLINDDPITPDPNDPAYEDTPVEDPGISIESKISMETKSTLTVYKQKISGLITDFFVHGDVGELVRSIDELGTYEYGYELVKRIINMSFDRSDRERELVSRFLSEGYSTILSSTLISKGYLRLFESIDDVEIDVHGARDMLAKFLARSVVDETIPPAFLIKPETIQLGGDVVTHAKVLLSMEHAPALLESCWGPGDGRGVRQMKRAIDMLVKEFIAGGDMEEAMRCVRELQSPHFHHELIKRAVSISMDHNEQAQARIGEFFNYLYINEVLSSGQAAQGFNRLHECLSDLTLDIPSAPKILNKFIEDAKAAGILPVDYVPVVHGPAPSPVYEEEEEIDEDS